MAEMGQLKRSQILSPEEGVEIAWGRTIELSSNEAVREGAEIPKRLLEQKIKRAQSSVNNNELSYVESASAAISAAYRNLATARNYLDLNFAEAKVRTNKEEESIQYLEKFSLSLQSLIPKLASMTIGGVTLGVLVSPLLASWFPPQFQTYAFYLLLALGAAVAYFIHGFLLVPVVRRRLQKQLVNFQFDEIRYYLQYVARVKATLKSLYERLEQAHEDTFGSRYDQDITSEQVVKKILAGLEQEMCRNIADCLMNDKISPKEWSKCQTAINANKCLNFTGA
jgi:hypothetical protein